MIEYAIDVYLQFVSGNDPDSYYPGEDKLWLEILLDEYRNGHYFNTIDCNGLELPLEYVWFGEKEWESVRRKLTDEAAWNVAEMLNRNPQVHEYRIDESIGLSYINVANGFGFSVNASDEVKRDGMEW